MSVSRRSTLVLPLLLGSGTAAPAQLVLSGRAPAGPSGLVIKLNGSMGRSRIERVGRRDPRARLTLEGTRPTQPGESCTVRLEEAVALTARGRADGLLRDEVGAPACPIIADLIDGGAMGSRPGSGLHHRSCRLPGRSARHPPAPFGKSTRLTERARPQEVRAVASEQAAVSAEREMLCRSYAREASHGFRDARCTQARAA